MWTGVQAMFAMSHNLVPHPMFDRTFMCTSNTSHCHCELNGYFTVYSIRLCSDVTEIIFTWLSVSFRLSVRVVHFGFSHDSNTNKVCKLKSPFRLLVCRVHCFVLT
ncbi:hypothetical protein NP493_3g08028 [Ridgeia piscesae]|uniref:Uncharacterized protein n=1 Tax=Ridgeia piscesae TaxID=27915 RepID=A0AAD9PFW2_RIDPI|nr:hypothetical protein NP493_3g08028 [Ridgeia piscesae]